MSIRLTSFSTYLTSSQNLWGAESLRASLKHLPSPQPGHWSSATNFSRATLTSRFAW
jgi:hypothetical protein